MKRLLLLAALCLLGSLPAGAAGFQWATAPDPEDAPLQVAIWYPSPGKTGLTTIGPFDMNVAPNGTLAPGKHPLIVMSHGTGGMALNSFDTAIAFANAGFIVASVTHTGDNYRDQSYAFTRRQLVDRPRHISRVIDFMLGGWAGHNQVDAGRIGGFGHSAGGTTALLLAGGTADVAGIVAFCQDHPADWGCTRARDKGLAPADLSPVTGQDRRIRAIVIAAPALASGFAPNGLAAVTVPVQLWVGARDEIVTDAALVRTLLPTPPEYHPVANGGHFAYLAPCGDWLRRSAPEICANPDGFDRAAFLTGFQGGAITFFRAKLTPGGHNTTINQ